MSENKIFTLHLPAELEDKIMEDRNSFLPTMNKSSFISLIIMNYHDQYEMKYLKLRDVIKNSVKKEDSNLVLSDSSYNNIVWSIVEHMENNRLSNEKKSRKDRKINLRLNTKGNEELDLILDSIPAGSTQNSFVRSILSSYLDLPKAERERILCKKNLSKIMDALDKNCKILLTTKKSKFTINPIEIYSSKEQLFNYLIYETEPNVKHPERKMMSIHLKNIVDVHPSFLEERVLSEYYRIKMDRMIKNGVQFGSENQYYKVKFNKDGKNRFKFSYLEKPDPIEVDEENGIYTFDCTQFHFRRYFAPFYNEMEILEPESEIEYLKQILKETQNIYQ